MADLIRAKVASGEYATESEVIRDGLRVLIARDRMQEKWLQDKVLNREEIGSSDQPKSRKTESAGAAGRRTRARKAPAASTSARVPEPPAPEEERPARTVPEPPSFEFGRMQVVLKDAPG